MCGIVGIADFSKQAIGYSELNMFQQLLIADSARGMDGTGIIKISDKGASDWRKIQGHPFALFEARGVRNKFIQPIMNKEYIRFLIGHNRYGTTGAKDTASAHPFQHKHITLVHNGTVSSGSSLPELKEFKVDSEALCASIARIGIEDTVKKMFGPFSIVYFNSQTKTVNFLRNYGRPMFMGVNKTRDLVMFGSEKELLTWVAERNNIINIGFTSTPVDTLVSFSLDDIVPTEKKVTPYYAPYNSSTSYSGGSHYSGYGGLYEDEGGEAAEWTYEWDPVTRQYTHTQTISSPESTKPAEVIQGGSSGKSEKSKVIMLPSQSPKSTTSIPRKQRYKPIDEARGYKKGGDITFDAYIHAQQLKNPDKTTITGGVEDIPEFEIRFSCLTGADTDAFLAADKLRGTILAMVIDFEAPVIQGRQAIIMHVHNVVGLARKEKEFSLKDIEETAAMLAAEGIQVLIPDE